MSGSKRIRSIMAVTAGVLGCWLAMAPSAARDASDAREPQKDPRAGAAKSPGNQPRKGHKRSVVGELDCGNCHTTDGWRLFDGAGGAGGFDHARTGFPLTGSHRKASCLQCHAPETEVKRECATCHQDAHKGRFGLACDECHDAVSWKNTRASRRHRLTRLPLSGVHALLDCSSCHVRSTEGTWTGAPAECFACHETDYRRDIHPNHQGGGELAPFPITCQDCHRPTAWTPAFIRAGGLQAGLTGSGTRASPRHDAVFPISYGKHRNAACQSCHLTLEVPANVRCTGCHAHDARLLRMQHRGNRVAGDGSACLRCHPRGAAR